MPTSLSLSTVSLPTGVVSTPPGVPAVLRPPANKLAHASGLPLETVLMTQVVGLSTTLLPYQSALLVVAAQIAGKRLAATASFFIVLAVVTVVVLWPLAFLWWRLTGRL